MDPELCATAASEQTAATFFVKSSFKISCFLGEEVDGVLLAKEV